MSLVLLPGSKLVLPLGLMSVEQGDGRTFTAFRRYTVIHADVPMTNGR